MKSLSTGKMWLFATGQFGWSISISQMRHQLRRDSMFLSFGRNCISLLQ
ncbi:MAG: hypothetical protein K2N44_07310 [Lachnospiraceae bacterium]|nr:hypothetical protein [Lachnospiraceae bacterium]